MKQKSESAISKLPQTEKTDAFDSKKTIVCYPIVQQLFQIKKVRYERNEHF